jgi:hypothetical protein
MQGNFGLRPTAFLPSGTPWLCPGSKLPKASTVLLLPMFRSSARLSSGHAKILEICRRSLGLPFAEPKRARGLGQKPWGAPGKMEAHQESSSGEKDEGLPSGFARAIHGGVKALGVSPTQALRWWCASRRLQAPSAIPSQTVWGEKWHERCFSCCAENCTLLNEKNESKASEI